MPSQQATSWLGTLNNPDTTSIEAYLKAWFDTGCTYVNGQLEKGAEGTIHIQFFLVYPKDKKKTLAALKKHDNHAHFIIIKQDNGASDYCLKEETRLEGPWEFGIKPARKNVKGDTKTRNLKILELGPERCVEEGLINIKEYLKVKESVDAYRLNTTKQVEHPGTIGTWIHGPPGVGKSHKARADHPDAYIKQQNKWWNGYQGQSAVILDDLDSDCLGHYIKIWADKYPCTGEVKGSYIPLQHKDFIITSNHLPEDLFKDPVMALAIRRRFKFIHITDPFNIRGFE